MRKPLREAWDYPIKPGSEEWRTTSYAEKIEQSQPPKELMEAWDTEVLFKYCIEYPFNKVILMFSNPNDGFKRVYEQSIVWQEFVDREDALNILAGYVKDRSYVRLFNMTNISNRNEELFVLFFLEKMISETNFVVRLGTSEKKKLASVILDSYQGKKNYPEEFTGFHNNSSLSALLKIVESDQTVSEKDGVSLKKFREKTNNEYFTDDDMDDAIEKKAINYINKKL